MSLVNNNPFLKEARARAEEKHGYCAVGAALALIAYIYDSRFGAVGMRWADFVWGNLNEMRNMFENYAGEEDVNADECHFLAEVIDVYTGIPPESSSAFDELGKSFFPRKE
ncbi:MAG: hypothetical protein AAB678_01015 [Patescibacteria group bacterium]